MTPDGLNFARQPDKKAQKIDVNDLKSEFGIILTLYSV